MFCNLLKHNCKLIQINNKSISNKWINHVQNIFCQAVYPVNMNLFINTLICSFHTFLHDLCCTLKQPVHRLYVCLNQYIFTPLVKITGCFLSLSLLNFVAFMIIFVPNFSLRSSWWTFLSPLTLVSWFVLLSFHGFVIIHLSALCCCCCED